MICCSDRNVVRDNVVAHNADAGITVCCGSIDTVVEHNEVLDNAINGIIVLFGATGTSVRENHAARNGNDIVIFEASGNTVSRNRATDALVCLTCFGPTGFGIGITGGSTTTWSRTMSSRGPSRTASGSPTSIRRTPAIRCPTGPPCAGTSSATRAKTASMSTPAIEGTVLEHNGAFGAGHDGIRVDSAAAVLTRKRGVLQPRPRDRGRAGVTDGGGNRAHGNGNPAQCTGVACG